MALAGRRGMVRGAKPDHSAGNSVYFEDRLPGLIDYENCKKFFVQALLGDTVTLVERPKADNDVFARVASGKLKVGCGLASQAYSALSREGNYFVGIPFGFYPDEQASWLIDEGWDIQKQIYAAHKVVPVPIAVVTESGGHFLERIPDNPHEFNRTGWRVRWYGMGQEVLGGAFRGLSFNPAQAGGAPLAYFGYNGDRSNNPAAKLHGFEFATPNTDWDLVYGAKVHRANDPRFGTEYWQVDNPAVAGARYYYNTWHQPTQVFEFWFNLDYWNDLGPAKQEDIKNAMEDSLNYALNIDQEGSLNLITEEIAAAAGSQDWEVGMDWPEAVIDKLKRAAEKTYQTDYRKNKNIRRILDSMAARGWNLWDY
jgi:hypothetical protein